MKTKYVYQLRGTVIRVIDGDTVECTFPVTDRVTLTEIVRFQGINAPEDETPEGEKTKQYVTTRLLGKEVLVHFSKREKYSRLLAKVYLIESDTISVDINQELLDKGFAAPYVT